MGVCENKASFAVDNDPGTEAGSFLRPLKTVVEKVLEKTVEKRVALEI